MVEETEWYAAYVRLTELLGPAETGPDAVRRTLEDAAALGIVGLVDLEFDERPGTWAARSAAGAAPLRVRVGAYAGTLAEYLALGLRTGDPLPGCDPRVTMGPLKIISDGSLNTRTAWCCAPYADRAGDRRPQPLVGRAAAAADPGHRGRPRGGHPRDRRRGRARGPGGVRRDGRRGLIEHAQLMTHADVGTMAGSACGRACSRLTSSTTATSPSGAGRTGPTWCDTFR